jgi:hypothetical protein
LSSTRRRRCKQSWVSCKPANGRRKAAPRALNENVLHQRSSSVDGLLLAGMLASPVCACGPTCTVWILPRPKAAAQATCNIYMMRALAVNNCPVGNARPRQARFAVLCGLVFLSTTVFGWGCCFNMISSSSSSVLEAGGHKHTYVQVALDIHWRRLLSPCTRCVPKGKATQHECCHGH